MTSCRLRKGNFASWLRPGNGGAQRPRFALWLGETADVGTQRGVVAPWLGETADVGA